MGSYRNNEVDENHMIFPWIDALSASGTKTTKLSLEGLSREDLNCMISDALCMFPRLCEPLSEIVFQKTHGNPFFALSFLSSLTECPSSSESPMLTFCDRKRAWVWDEGRVSSLDISGNVLLLLTSKMNGLSKDVQLALKVVACFGTKMKELWAKHLSSTLQYSSICNGLDESCRLGLMVKSGSDWRLVHDKVREAAMSLIPDSEKSQVSSAFFPSLTVAGNLILTFPLLLFSFIIRWGSHYAQQPNQ